MLICDYNNCFSIPILFNQLNNLFELTFIIIDILPFAINEFSRIFIESMNKEDTTFKSQYILQSLAKIDPGFTYNITHNSDNKVTSIVWMTSYVCENLERFGNNISINIIESQVCNAKKVCYIAPVVLNKIGKMNVACEGFVISETHDACCFILESIFKIGLGRGKRGIRYIF